MTDRDVGQDIDRDIGQDIDWDALRGAAIEAAARAYAPYSRYPVGAAALGSTTAGRWCGCNVENASYGLGLCAECGLVSALHAGGGGRWSHVVCVDFHGEVLMPCGRCRQLLWEHGGPGLLVMTPRRGRVPMAEVLPDAFGRDDLDRGEGPRDRADGWRR